MFPVREMYVKKQKTAHRGSLKMVIIIRNMFCDIIQFTGQDIAKPIQSKHGNIFVFS